MSDIPDEVFSAVSETGQTLGEFLAHEAGGPEIVTLGGDGWLSPHVVRVVWPNEYDGPNEFDLRVVDVVGDFRLGRAPTWKDVPCTLDGEGTPWTGEFSAMFDELGSRLVSQVLTTLCSVGALSEGGTWAGEVVLEV